MLRNGQRAFGFAPAGVDFGRFDVQGDERSGENRSRGGSGRFTPGYREPQYQNRQDSKSSSQHDAPSLENA
jgi:hypothetical protein